MLFRQLFEPVSCTYTYILASDYGREGLIIDPVLDHADAYAKLIRELDLKLVLTIDTHIHADHITASGYLIKNLKCRYVIGEQARIDFGVIKIKEGDTLKIDGITLDDLYTPGHTDDSYSFVMQDRVFTGDTLPDPKHRTYGFPERRLLRPLRQPFQKTFKAPRRNSCLPGP